MKRGTTTDQTRAIASTSTRSIEKKMVVVYQSCTNGASPC